MSNVINIYNQASLMKSLCDYLYSMILLPPRSSRTDTLFLHRRSSDLTSPAVPDETAAVVLEPLGASALIGSSPAGGEPVSSTDGSLGVLPVSGSVASSSSGEPSSGSTSGSAPLVGRPSFGSGMVTLLWLLRLVGQPTVWWSAAVSSSAVSGRACWRERGCTYG